MTKSIHQMTIGNWRKMFEGLGFPVFLVSSLEDGYTVGVYRTPAEMANAVNASIDVFGIQDARAKTINEACRRIVVQLAQSGAIEAQQEDATESE